MDISVPAIGSTELRPDLEEFEVATVMTSHPEFDNSHSALLAKGEEWFGMGMDAVEAAKNAQLKSGKHLGGFALQRLAYHAEEAYMQFQARSDGREVGHE